MLAELPPDALRATQGLCRTPADLRQSWQDTLSASREVGEPPSVRHTETGLSLVRTDAVEFSGWGGHRINAWLHTPAAATAGAHGADVPVVVVQFPGYGGGRGLAHQVPLWTLAGYACLSMDVRGQGSEWGAGDTADPVGSAPSFPGFLTRGLLDGDGGYYRRVITDAVRAVDAVADLPRLAGARVVVAGASQGGGLALAAAGLCANVAAVLVDVPFLCDFRRAVEVATTRPYAELRSFLAVRSDVVEEAFAALDYVDAAILGSTAQAPALFSVAMMDEVCPPSTVYAAYNRYGGPKEVVEYPYGDHAGGGPRHEQRQLAWLTDRLA